MLQILTSLFLSLFCRSVDFSMCVNCRRCSGRLPDVANTYLSLPVFLSNLVQGGGMRIYSSTVTLTSCTFTSNTAVRCVVLVGWLMLQILTSLFLSLFCRSVDFRECVNCRRCSGLSPDVANTNLSFSVSFLSVGQFQYVRQLLTLFSSFA